jgi:hypothetical protein
MAWSTLRVDVDASTDAVREQDHKAEYRRDGGEQHHKPTEEPSRLSASTRPSSYSKPIRTKVWTHVDRPRRPSIRTCDTGHVSGTYITTSRSAGRSCSESARQLTIGKRATA